MLNVAQNFKRQINIGNRNYQIKINMTLADETQLTLTNADIWDSSLKISEATSSSDTFDIGSAVIGQCCLDLNNITDKFSEYDFFNATFWLYIGLDGDCNDDGEINYYRKGYYTVDVPKYNGSIISLTGLDNMWKFDAPFSDVTVNFPTTIGSIVGAMCSYCGVTLATPNFTGKNKTISTAPEGDINCREVLQYLAQICCKYCKIDANGQLRLGWYDKSAFTATTNTDGGSFSTKTTPYSDGANINGGTFAFNDGDELDGGLFTDQSNIAWITSHSTFDIGVDDIVATGCRVKKNGSDEDSYDYLAYDSELEETYPRYVLVIEDNPFIDGNSAESLANEISLTISGLPIRSFNASSLNNITYETGDPCTIVDLKGRRFNSYITNLSFTAGAYETFSCGAESLTKNISTRYSESVKTLVEAKRNAQKILSDYDKAVQNMNELAQEAIGYNEYVVTVNNKQIMYRYNGTEKDITIPDKPKFPDSTTVFKISGDGVFVSNGVDDQGYPIYTNGYDANSGTAILNLLYVNGLNADWIKAGTIDAINITGSTITGSKINGSSTFEMTAGNSSHDTTLNWGSTWGDSLTVVSNSNADGGLGVCQKGHQSDKAMYIHYNNIRWYDNSYNPREAQFGSPITSDIRLKKDIKNADKSSIRELFKRFRFVSFRYKDNVDPNENHGLIAQEVEPLLKELSFDTNTYIGKGADGYYKLFYPNLERLSMVAVQDLYEEIDLLKKEIELLKERSK